MTLNCLIIKTVKGHFCSFLLSSIICLPLFLQIEHFLPFRYTILKELFFGSFLLFFSDLNLISDLPLSLWDLLGIFPLFSYQGSLVLPFWIFGSYCGVPKSSLVPFYFFCAFGDFGFPFSSLSVFLLVF